MSVTDRTPPAKGTTVRFFRAPIQVRTAFRLLDVLLPSLSGYWAERIWFTLPPARTGTAGRRPGAGAGPGRRFHLDAGGCRLAGETWGDGPAVYLLHGWAGHRTQLLAFVAPLVSRGHRVIAFDAPSHGESGPGRLGPRSSSIPEFAAALGAVIDAHGPAHAVVAHSMGCTATAAMIRDGVPAGRVAMLAPMAGPLPYSRLMAGALGFGDRTLRRLIARAERRVGRPMTDFDVPAIARTSAVPPALVVHDVGDRSTPVSDGRAVAAAWPGARLHLTSGLGHTRLLSDPAVVALVVDFLTAEPAHRTSTRTGPGDPAVR